MLYINIYFSVTIYIWFHSFIHSFIHIVVCCRLLHHVQGECCGLIPTMYWTIVLQTASNKIDNDGNKNIKKIILSRTAEGSSLNIVQDSSQNLGGNLKLDSVHRCDNYKSMLFIVIENFRPNKACLYHSSNIFQIFFSISFNNNKNQFLLYPPATKLQGGYTGFTMSVRPSVCRQILCCTIT